jgi:hypothetical protein
MHFLAGYNCPAIANHLEHLQQSLQIWLFKIIKSIFFVILTAHLFRSHFSASLL